MSNNPGQFQAPETSPFPQLTTFPEKLWDGWSDSKDLPPSPESCTYEKWGEDVGKAPDEQLVWYEGWEVRTWQSKATAGWRPWTERTRGGTLGQVKPTMRITYEWENKKAAVGKTILLRHTNTTLVTRVRLSRVVPTHIASDEQCLLQPCPQGLAL